MTKKQDANDELMARTNECSDLIKKLNTASNIEWTRGHDRKADWGHVGSAAEARNLLAQAAVMLGAISQEEFEKITGETY